MGMRKLATVMTLFFALVVLPFSSLLAESSVRPPANAVAQSVDERVGTSNTLGTNSQIDYWKSLRGGVSGKVSIPDKKAGVMVQSEGWTWMLFRNGPLKTYGGYGMAFVIAALALFFMFRGTIKIESGLSGDKILRFNRFARWGHWVNAIAFVLLALTGLNMLYGKSVLLPIIGAEAFSSLTMFGKFIHNFGAFAFILGIVWIFVAFVGKNFFSRDDVTWISEAGGLMKKGSHTPTRFFNFGEKMVFWSAIIGGVAIIVTGLALLFPFQLNFFPGELAVHKMQFASMWHGIIGLFLIAVIIGHIYMGTIGIEGAFESMKSGYVDRNWAKEHHSLWLDEVDRSMKSKGDASNEPAE